MGKSGRFENVYTSEMACWEFNSPSFRQIYDAAACRCVDTKKWYAVSHTVMHKPQAHHEPQSQVTAAG